MSEKMKILIGYDGANGADLALDDLRRAGLPQPRLCLRYRPGESGKDHRSGLNCRVGESANAGGESRWAHSAFGAASSPQTDGRSPVRIIIGVDGSPGAEAAVRVVASAGVFG